MCYKFTRIPLLLLVYSYDTEKYKRFVRGHCLVHSFKISSLVNDPVLPSNIFL